MSVTITEYGEKQPGCRRRQINVAQRGVSIVVDPASADSEPAAVEIASALQTFLAGHEANRTSADWRAIEAEAKCAKLQARIDRLESLVPPPSPVRVFNGGCVRFDDKGRLHLMNQREKGWASFSIVVDGWDDLFRRYAVRIGEHGTDKAGAYWLVISEAR